MLIKIWEIPREKSQEVEAVLKAEETKDEKGNLKINEFARNGYILREGKVIGMEKDVKYLYIEGTEEFFENNEKKLPKGLKTVEGKEFEQIKKKIEEEQNETAAGVGLIFGD